MKKSIILGTGILLILFNSLSMAQEKVPLGVAGFVLGKNIDAYEDRVKMGTSMPIRYMEYIKEVEIKPMEGFKSGIIAYSACHSPGTIVRIKLKYADFSKKFYNQLLKSFKKRFGEPAEWRGDAFRIVMAWKWSFTDDNNNKISLTLQHNTRDAEEKKGNSVKMTMTNLFEEEYRCFKKKYPDYRVRTAEEIQGGKTWEKADWDRFVPK